MFSASVGSVSNASIFSVYVIVDALYKEVLGASSHGTVCANKSNFLGKVIWICNHSLLLNNSKLF